MKSEALGSLEYKYNSPWPISLGILDKPLTAKAAGTITSSREISYGPNPFALLPHK